MRKIYFLFATILSVASLQAQIQLNKSLNNNFVSNTRLSNVDVITGNLSICLPGPNTTQLSASVPPASISATTPWFSSNSSVATINSSGLVTGLSFGTTTISYTDNLGSTYSVNVNVSTFPTISAPNGTSICEAGIVQLQGSLFPNAVNAWESLNTGIATVNSSGLVTGVAAGTVNILYRNLGGCTTTIPITVKPSLVPIITCGAITPSSITFNWNSLPGASTYVRYSQLNGGPITSLGSDAPFTFTINNLSPQDQVTFYVVATGTAGNCFQLGQASCSTTPCPDAGTNGFTTICDTSTASINLFSLITGEDLGGVWTRTGGTGGVFNSVAGVFTPNSGATTSTFTYTISGSGPCPNDTSIATININQQPDAGTDGSTTICETSTASINLFSLIIGEQPGGTWTRLTGTGGTFNSAVGVFTPNIGATTSTFRYTAVASAPCLNDISIATININQQPDAGTDGSITICETSTTSINLFSLINGEDLGGFWVRASGTGGTFDSVAGVFTLNSGATTSTFTYTILGSAPCIADVSIATININQQPNAGFASSTTICDSSSTTIDLFSLIDGEQTGGTWSRIIGTGGIFDAIAGTYTPAPGATNSIFEYRIAGVAPCVDDFSIVPVNINQQPNAGIEGSITVCDSSSATIDLFSLIDGEQTGGTWTRLVGSGGIFDAIVGTYTPVSGATSSVFEYRITGVSPCIDDFSIATININQQPDAGIDGCISVADESSLIIDLYSLITGEQVGGTWTRTSGSGGTFDSLAATYIPAIGATTSTFSYTISGVAPCLDDSSIATIGINEQLGQAVTLFCDLANSTPNSFAFDWNNIGQTSFNFSYSIDGGPTITGNTIVSNYQIFGVTPGQSVTFTVQPVGNLCYSTTTVNCDLLSAVDFESDTVKYYPNPFNDILNLSFSQSIESIQIFNILGQQVFDTNHRAKDFQINLSHLSSGTYLVKAISNDSAKIFKVVKY